MTSLYAHLILFAFLAGQVALLSAAAYWLGRRAKHAGVALWLRKSAVFVGGFVVAALAIWALLGGQCEGNVLYGYRDCRSVSPDTAENSGGLAFLALVLGAAYTVVLAVVCAVVEIAHRRPPPY